ncbi:MAG TPA: hypothetical protein VFV50_07015 [Bdellovibrionales bacterium]|nr:hypothetical protein [Bdellovibrionales bacterium]
MLRTQLIQLFAALIVAVVTTTSHMTTAHALALSHSGEEVRYTYEVTYRTLHRGPTLTAPQIRAAAALHAAHVFGLFHSPEVAAATGFPADLIEGFAGTKPPQILAADITRPPTAQDPYAWVRYQAQGSMIVHKPVLARWLRGEPRAKVILPLLKDFPSIYRDDFQAYTDAKWRRCTDDHYWRADEFSYFYNPYRCPELGRAPIATDTIFYVERSTAAQQAVHHFVPLQQIQGANGNGNLTVLYFANGFDQVPRPGAPPNVIHRDSGWKTYAAIEQLVTRVHGFRKIESLEELRAALGADFHQLNLLTPATLNHDPQRRYFSTYVKKTARQTFVVRSALLDAGNEGRLRSFPKFWKEAWENGDVIYFGGHSGDGEALSLYNMLGTLNKADLDSIQFRRDKTQIALIDSCSSYGHYQDLYAARKPYGLHMVTYGLVSLFHLAPATIAQLLDITLSQGQALRWTDALALIEQRQLRPHVEYIYEPRDHERMYREYLRRGTFPTGLLTVHVQ